MNKNNAKTLLIVSLLTTFSVFSQSYKEDIKKYQEEQNKEFKDPEHSPLSKEDIKHFEALEFFPINESYNVVAFFMKKKGKKFEMNTSTDRKPIYQKVGELHFIIIDQPGMLSVYKNVEYSKTKEGKDYLFIPFKDFTNGSESYGGGRYLDITKPEKREKWILDFNKSYNPYCSYSDRYSCPIPPEENHLKIKINAGVKKYH